MAVDVGKVVPLLPSLTTSNMELSVAKGEGACQNSANCRKTQQKFLHPLSKDTRICKSRKGQGGNTASQHCFVIPKSVLDADDLAAICEGMFKWVCLLHKYGKRLPLNYSVSVLCPQ